jgi:hypothetical protein
VIGEVLRVGQNYLRFQHAIPAQDARKPMEAIINPLAVFIREGKFWFKTKHEGSIIASEA